MRIRARLTKSLQLLGRPLEYVLPRGEIAIFHEFHRPPYGGGNQFLLALKEEFLKRGISVSVNRVGRRTRAVLFNSFNFDFDSILRLKGRGFRMVHRVDGPISVYRGETGKETVDQRIHEINNRIADRTILQSQYSLRAHKAIGIQFRSPTVIMNAVDPKIFFPKTGTQPHERLRVVSSAWSSNPRKGLAVYQWLDENLDPKKFEFTFIGQIQHQFRNFKQIDAVPSEKLADLLRSHDVYLAASEHDPCSNALIEALSCGLPAIFRRSGGHPEIVGKAGLGFDAPEEIPSLLTMLCKGYPTFQDAIRIPTVQEVAERYLAVLLS